MSPFASTFQLSVTAALRDQLLDLLEDLEVAPLNEENIRSLEKRGGIYTLYCDDRLVYIGKSSNALPNRLRQHRTKLSGRQHGVLDRVTFKCVYVNEDLDAVAPETLLIERARAQGLAEWNTNGFGNKDPGSNRDTTVVKTRHFDREFPINLDLEVTLHVAATPVTLLDVMASLKQALPYTFRYERGPESRRLALDVTSEFVNGDVRTAREWISWIAERLPASWRIVALPGYVIAYPDLNPEIIPSRTESWVPRPDLRRVHHETHAPIFSNEPLDDSEVNAADD